MPPVQIKYVSRLVVFLLAGIGGAAAVLAAMALGPVAVPPDQVARVLLDRVPGLDVTSSLTPLQASIVTEVRWSPSPTHTPAFGR